VQVADVVAAHAHALARGMTEGLAPLRLGDVAAISFVRLPDGDWIELSQRASLTGALPDDLPPA
jgi:lactoylglutathione lyase